MKVSEIKLDTVLDFIRIDIEAYDDITLNKVKKEIEQQIMPAVLSFIKSDTGLREGEIDTYPDITLAYLIKCQDFYDNRSSTNKEVYENKSIECILEKYRKNLL